MMNSNFQDFLFLFFFSLCNKVGFENGIGFLEERELGYWIFFKNRFRIFDLGFLILKNRSRVLGERR